jgi:hypothetical protein
MRKFETRALLENRRTILLCLAGVCVVLLMCWHREIMHGLYAMKRRADVQNVMNAHGHQYKVRGPLTIAQLETELFGRPLDSRDIAGISASADFLKAWGQFRESYETGDEFYFVDSDERSWAQLTGWRGYVLIRKNEVVGSLTTFLN